MNDKTQLISDLYSFTDTDPNLQDPDTAHLVISGNKVLGMHAVPGLNIDVNELADGIEAEVRLKPGFRIKKQVHLCFGMLPQSGTQRINLDVDVGDDSRISLLAHCVFPMAVDVRHIMDAKLRLGKNAQYDYFEKHVHGVEGGVKVYPKAVVDVGPNSLFRTEFELIKGRVGLIDIDYEANCDANAVVDMSARISGRGDDQIKIKEAARLEGEHSRGLLTSKLAVRDNAKAEIHNVITATAAYARGHVDCKEIVQDNGWASAIPIVDVRHPRARITHEAAIGSVDNKQLETLMTRGLSEDEAVEIIINGLLSR
jgi:Fe-S cluster assembly scaffold protein SufB